MSAISSSVLSDLVRIDQPDSDEWIRLYSPVVTKKTARELEVQWFKRQLGAKADAWYEMTDSIFSNVIETLRSLSEDSPFPEGDAWIELLQFIEAHSIRCWRTFNRPDFRTSFGIRWSKKVAKELLDRGEIASNLVSDIKIHDGTVAANSVESKMPLTPQELIAELAL